MIHATRWRSLKSIICTNEASHKIACLLIIPFITECQGGQTHLEKVVLPLSRAEMVLLAWDYFCKIGCGVCCTKPTELCIFNGELYGMSVIYQ